MGCNQVDWYSRFNGLCLPSHVWVLWLIIWPVYSVSTRMALLIQKNILALPCLVSGAYTLSCLSYELMTCLVVRISCIRKTRMPCMKILYEKNTMACLGISCMACLTSPECLLWPVWPNNLLYILPSYHNALYEKVWMPCLNDLAPEWPVLVIRVPCITCFRLPNGLAWNSALTSFLA